MNTFNVFFANKTTDQGTVDELCKQLARAMPNYPIVDLSKKVPALQEWQAVAKPLIGECDAMVCVVGKDAHSSTPIDWEVRTAAELGKPIYAVLLDNQHILPQAIQDLGVQVRVWDPDRVAAELGYILIEQALFQNGRDCADTSAIWQQYELAVQTWESLISRRQTVNSLYMTASGAILAGMGAVMSAVGNTGAAAGALAISMFSFIGLLLCYNWEKTLISYGVLSKAKASIVTTLERKLPARLFDAEWRILEAGKYKSTTQSDRETIRGLRLLFGTILLAAVGYVVRSKWPV